MCYETEIIYEECVQVWDRCYNRRKIYEKKYGCYQELNRLEYISKVKKILGIKLNKERRAILSAFYTRWLKNKTKDVIVGE